MFNADRVFNFIRIGMNTLNDPVISAVVNETIKAATVKKIPVPGFSKEDIKVTHNKGKLVVKADNKFLAAYHIPHDIDPSKIEVSVENGLLTIDFENAFGTETEINIK